MATVAVPEEKKGPSRLWIPVIILIGLLLGVAISFFVQEPPFFWHYAPFELQEALMFHIVLSTIGVTLLVSLAMVYMKVYAETGARFSLGLVVVLLALLIQSLIQYPLFLGLVGGYAISQEQFLPFADIFTIVAYTIFLYLSLE